MEKSIKIDNTNIGLTEKRFMLPEECCCMCDTPITTTGETEEKLIENLQEEGYSYLVSDLYGLEGYWCGCNYK